MRSTFIKGRSIRDNTLVPFEVIHYMKSKTNGKKKKGDVALKIEFCKYYDRFDLGFVDGVMRVWG